MAVAPLTGKARQAVQLSTAPLNVYEGSVRSGKTIASILAWLHFVRTGPAGPLLLAGKTERTVKRNIIDPMIEMLGKKRCHYIQGAGELWLLGRLVYVAGANDERSHEKIKGLSLAGAYLDEATTVPESFWTMLRSRLSIDGARLYTTTNPASPGHWLKRDWLNRAGLHLTGDGDIVKSASDTAIDLNRFSFRLTDNPNLPQGYVKQIKRDYTGLFYKRYVLGEWVAAEGAVYDMFDTDVHVVDILPPIQRWLGVGIDVGTTNPTHALLLGLGVDGVLYITAEFRYDARQQHRQLTDAEYSRRIRHWLQQVPIPATRQADGTWLRGVTPEYVVVDPSAASFRVQLYEDGLATVAANNEVLDGIRVVSSLFSAGKLKIHKSCPELIAEIPGYAWDDRAALLGDDKPIKVDDHGCDGMRYVVKTTRSLWHSHIQLAA